MIWILFFYYYYYRITIIIRCDRHQRVDHSKDNVDMLCKRGRGNGHSMFGFNFIWVTRKKSKSNSHHRNNKNNNNNREWSHHIFSEGWKTYNVFPISYSSYDNSLPSCILSFPDSYQFKSNKKTRIKTERNGTEYEKRVELLMHFPISSILEFLIFLKGGFSFWFQWFKASMFN